MKKCIMIAALAAAAILTGCASAPSITFKQQVAIVCGAAKSEVAILQADGAFTGGAEDTLNKKIVPAVADVCSAAPTDLTLSSFVNETLPAVGSIVQSSSLSQDQKNAARAAIDTLVLAANTAIALAASVPTAASAPAAQ